MSEFWRSSALPHLESRRSCKENSCYRPHTHDRLSIGLIDTGSTIFSGAGNEALELNPGDTIIIPAGHVHACNPESGTWMYQMIHADQDWIAALLPQDSTVLTGIHVFSATSIYNSFHRINELFFANAEESEITNSFSQAFALCSSSEPNYFLAAKTDAELLGRLSPVLEKLRDDEQNPMLEELALIAGMGKYQLIRSMKQTTGLSPLAWRQNYRVQTARKLLREGSSLADTAHTLGFVDQSHFHRVFRAHVAASPGTYRLVQ